MNARIVACAQCGQRNRLSVTSTKKGIWKCRTCGGTLSEADAVSEPVKSRRGLIVASGVLIVAAVMIAVYGSFWQTEASRSRTFAAAAAYEFNEGSFDRAAVLALFGLPNRGFFSLFQPGDAEAALRRTGIHQIKDERVIPKAKDAGFTAVKERFLVRMTDGAELILTDVTSGQDHQRSIATVCAGVRARAGSDGCIVSEIETDDEGRRLLLALTDGSIWLVNSDNSVKMIVAPRCPKGAGQAEPGSAMTSRIHLSASGRYAVINSKAQAFMAFDLDGGAERTIDFSRDCDSERTAVAKTVCQEYQVRVLMFRGDDVLFSRHGSRATLWALSE